MPKNANPVRPTSAMSRSSCVGDFMVVNSTSVDVESRNLF